MMNQPSTRTVPMWKAQSVEAQPRQNLAEPV